MRVIRLTLGLCLAIAAGPVEPRPEALPATPDLQSLGVIRHFIAGEGERLWLGLGGAPFGILLIDASEETIFCRQPLPAGFETIGYDADLGCPAGRRRRSGLPAGLLAAMPIFGPPSTIVMGTPKATGRSRPDWIRTVFHEHFHQWQDSLPDFYQRLAALNLSGGDETGMWMLNFDFPYRDRAITAAFNAASAALIGALDARGTKQYRAKLRNYAAARRRLAHAAGERNWRYAELELWKEGVARWTEIELGKRFPDESVRTSAKDLEKRSLDWLRAPQLADAGREFAYPYGVGEAMLLEYCSPTWRKAYGQILALGPLIDRAATSCEPSRESLSSQAIPDHSADRRISRRDVSRNA